MVLQVNLRHVKQKHALCEKWRALRSFFWPVFSRIRTEYGEIQSIYSPNAGKYGPEKTPYFIGMPTK